MTALSEKRLMELPSVSKDPDAPPPYSFCAPGSPDSNHSREISPDEIHPAFRQDFQQEQSRGLNESYYHPTQQDLENQHYTPPPQQNSGQRPAGPPPGPYYPSLQYTPPPPQYGPPGGWQAPLPPVQPHPAHRPSSQPALAPPIPQYPPYGSTPAQQPALPPMVGPNFPVRRICVIPQISKLFGGEHMSPFARVRVPELECQAQIPPQQLIEFIDGLNEAFMANSGLQATNAAGNIVGLVPMGTTQLIRAGLHAAAGMGAWGATHKRTEAYIAKSNADIFNPRGMHAQICKTEKMLGYIGMAGQTDIFNRQQHLIMVQNAHAPLQGTEANPIRQRMTALGDRAMQLSFDNVDVAVLPNNWTAKAGAWTEKRQLEKMVAKRDKREERCLRRERKGKCCHEELKNHKRDGRDANKLNKLLWLVITTNKEAAPGDNEWQVRSLSV